MSIEDVVFKRYAPDFDKLESYGFTKLAEGFVIEKLFKDNLFKAVITIDFGGKVSGVVFDLENDDEFLPLRVESNQGAFVGEVKFAYTELLEDIRDNVFTKKYFIYPQSNRITNLIIKNYGAEPEFLWKTTPGSGVFRNSETKKWFLAVLDVDRSKIQKDRNGFVEVALLKLNPNEIERLTKQKHYYPGYHMNKKYWITVILDDTLTDKRIMELVEESFSYSVKK